MQGHKRAGLLMAATCAAAGSRGTLRLHRHASLVRSAPLTSASSMTTTDGAARRWSHSSDAAQPRKREVVLYTKLDCPLCHKAKAVLQRVQAQEPFELKEVDILKSGEEILNRYCFDIPVVHLDGKEVFRHRVDEEKMLALVREPPSL